MRTKINGAVLKEQRVTFAIVAVKKHILNSRIEANKAIGSFSQVFPGIPVVLMAQDYRGTPSYFGRRDIVNFLSRINPRRIPWKEYTVSV